MRSLIAITLAGLLSAGCGLFPKTRTPPIAVQAAAPAWSLEDQNGQRVSLADLTQRGPALLVFYRGYW